MSSPDSFQSPHYMSEKLDIQFQKQFPKNLLSNVVYFLLNLIIGLALVPFFLETLGESAYGLIPLATSLSSYVTLFIDVANEAISRYLTIDLQRGDREKAAVTFNTALFGTFAIIFIAVPVVIGLSSLAPILFNIGDTAASDVFWLFALVLGSVLIRAWGSNFMVALFAYNRLDLRSTVNNTNLLVQLSTVILLFTLIQPTLPFVGFSYLIAACIALLLSLVLSKKVCPFLRISLAKFSLSRLKTILSTTLWLTILRLGVVMRAQMALIITNITFGTIAGAEFSLVLTWNTLIVGILGLVTTCFVPMIFSYRVNENKAGMTTFIVFSIKIVTLLTALLVGLACIFSSQLMTIWVGDSYAHLSSLMWIVIIGSMFLVQFSCCGSITAAYVRVRTPAIIYLVAGGFNVVLALILPLGFNMGIYGIALANLITTLITDALFGPVYAAHVLKLPLTTFIKPAVPGYIALVILLICGFLLTRFITVSGIIQTFTAGSVISIIYLMILWYAVLKKEDRQLIASMLPEKLRGRLPQWVMGK